MRVCVLRRYHQLDRANEQLAGQLKEAHEALFEVQTAVQATPVHKRKEQRHLLSRLTDAEQVCSLTLLVDWALQQERTSVLCTDQFRATVGHRAACAHCIVPHNTLLVCCCN